MTLFRKKATLEVIWISRWDRRIQRADRASRSEDSDDYGLTAVDQAWVDEMVQGRPYSADMFATTLQFVTRPFFSKVPMTGSSGCQGQYQDWRGYDLLFMFPPKNLVIQCLKRIKMMTNFEAVFVLLHSQTTDLMDVLMDSSGHCDPRWIQQIRARPVKVKVPRGQGTTHFTRSYHTLVALHVSTRHGPSNIQSRCARPRMKCPCGENKFVTATPVRYHPNEFIF